MMSAPSMMTVWILAWLALTVQMMASETSHDEDQISEHKSETQNEEEERSLHKRQLDFDGGGGGVNRYVNGDHDYEDYEDYDIEYWTQVMGK